jgi:hypothetical protein
VSARSAAQRLDQAGDPGHLVWNPHNGEIIQLIPIVRAGRSLGPADGQRAACWSEPVAGDGNVNAEGRVCVQICVVARADEPFTDGPPFPECHTAVRSRRLWARGGHFGASQVPGLTATGPGAIDPERLTGRAPAKGGHLAAAAAAARGDGPLHAAPVPVPAVVPAVVPAAVPVPAAGQPSGAGYDPPDLGELLGTRSASLSRVH